MLFSPKRENVKKLTCPLRAAKKSRVALVHRASGGIEVDIDRGTAVSLLGFGSASFCEPEVAVTGGVEPAAGSSLEDKGQSGQ